MRRIKPLSTINRLSQINRNGFSFQETTQMLIIQMFLPKYYNKRKHNAFYCMIASNIQNKKKKRNNKIFNSQKGTLCIFATQ